MAADRSTCGQSRLRSLARDFTPAAGQPPASHSCMRVKTCWLGGAARGEPARRLLRDRDPGRVALMGCQLTSAYIMNADAQGNLTGTIQTRKSNAGHCSGVPGPKDRRRCGERVAQTIRRER
jgi:hypothetical protein